MKSLKESDNQDPIVMEEIETGTVEGCIPSPWAPCCPYTKTYTITRKYLYTPQPDSKCDEKK